MNTGAQTSVTNSEGGVRWVFINIRKLVGAFVARHKVASIVFISLMLLFGFLFREEWQPYAVALRRYIGPALALTGIVVLGYIFQRGRGWFAKGFVLLAVPALIAGIIAGNEYLSLWVRYGAVNVEELSKLPETDHERIQPLQSVHALAAGITGDSRQPAPPDFVWMRNRATGEIEFKWSMGVEPKYWLDKVFGSVDEVYTVSATDPSPRFSRDATHNVRFSVGEELWLSSRAHTAVTRTFGPLRFMNYEPTDVRYLEDDRGEIVEVVSLLRWRGILFPYPEFGGVVVIKQQRDPSVAAFIGRVLFGAGEWIPPERIQDHPYLRGQNILPYRVSRYIAESMRFMNGFMAPLPGYHQGDVRIPDAKSTNQQPYTVFFKATEKTPAKLYHYFSLEPYLDGKHGLVASVLIPADGSRQTFVYRHEDRNENLMGVSMVSTLVRDSKKNYNWDKIAPVEERPFVRYVDGKRHLLWLTTVVTYKSEKKDEFATGSVPEVVLVDAETQKVIWVDPADPASWIKQLGK